MSMGLNIRHDPGPAGAEPAMDEVATAMTEWSGEDGAAGSEIRPYPGVSMAKSSNRTGATGTNELRTPRGWES